MFALHKSRMFVDVSFIIGPRALNNACVRFFLGLKKPPRRHKERPTCAQEKESSRGLQDGPKTAQMDPNWELKWA